MPPGGPPRPENTFPTHASTHVSVPTSPVTAGTVKSPTMRAPQVTSPKHDYVMYGPPWHWQDLPRMSEADYAASLVPKTQCLLPHQSAVPVTTKHVRASHAIIPNSQQVAERVGLPVGVVMHPMAEPDTDAGEILNVVDFTETCGASIGIVRCRRCNAYINPYCQFTDGGRRWTCNLCRTQNQTPPEYFCALDKHGWRNDIQERPELTHATVELVAAPNMMVRPPQRPAYIFVIDVSYQSVKSGYLASVCSSLRDLVPDLSGERPQVALVTYDSTVHLHTLQSKKAERLLSLPELTHECTGAITEAEGLADVWLPCQVSELLASRDDVMPELQELLSRLPSRHANTQDVECALGSALCAAMKIFTGTGGKLCLFASGLPTVGVGKLTMRDDSKAYNTPKEVDLLKAASPWYATLAQFAVKEQTAIDLYLNHIGFCDIATISSLSKQTGGDVRVYGDGSGVVQQEHGKVHFPHDELLSADLNRALLRETGFEAVMRVRCTSGWSLKHLYGHYHLRSDLLTLPNCDPDKSYAMELVPGESVTGGQVCVQTALLYTNINQERRVRVHTAVYETSANVTSIYGGLDPLAVSCLLARKAVEKVQTEKLEGARAYVVERNVATLKSFRQLSGVRSDMLLLPSSITSLPLLSLGLLKGPALRGDGSMPVDKRSRALARLALMPADRLAAFLLPTVWLLHKGGAKVMRCSRRALRDISLALIDDAQRLVLWVNRRADPAELLMLFGQEDPSPHALPLRLDNALSESFWKVVDAAREPAMAAVSGGTPQLLVVRQDTPEEAGLVFRSLVEDEVSKVLAYEALLEHLQKKVNSAQN